MKPPTVTDKDVTWFCDVCREPVADHDGYLGVDVLEASRISELWKEHSASHPLGSSLNEMPDDTETGWYAVHAACGPDPEPASDYVIGIERIRTLRHVLHWTGHLMDKPWVNYTNWGRIVGAMGTPA